MYIDVFTRLDFKISPHLSFFILCNCYREVLVDIGSCVTFYRESRITADTYIRLLSYRHTEILTYMNIHILGSINIDNVQ